MSEFKALKPFIYESTREMVRWLQYSLDERVNKDIKLLHHTYCLTLMTSLPLVSWFLEKVWSLCDFNNNKVTSWERGV